jgi:hypothetical protein
MKNNVMFHTLWPATTDLICIFILRLIDTINSAITIYMSIFAHPSSILYFIFTYAFGENTFLSLVDIV